MTATVSGSTYTRAVSSTGDALIGRTLDGRYRVLRRVADGGMATVYLAVDERLDREVALKVMRQHLVHDDSFVTRFRREARSAASLSHPNVVAVFDQGTDGDHIFLAMEFVPGKTLRDVLRDEGPLSPRATLDIMEPVLLALAEAHGKGLIHRDVKPENVIISDSGAVKVADFGLARAVTSQTVTSSSGMLLGHGRLPVARAGRARGRRPPVRRLRGRARPLRDAHRRQGVHRRDADPRGLPARPRRGARALEPRVQRPGASSTSSSPRPPRATPTSAPRTRPSSSPCCAGSAPRSPPPTSTRGPRVPPPSPRPPPRRPPPPLPLRAGAAAAGAGAAAAGARRRRPRPARSVATRADARAARTAGHERTTAISLSPPLEGVVVDRQRPASASLVAGRRGLRPRRRASRRGSSSSVPGRSSRSRPSTGGPQGQAVSALDAASLDARVVEAFSEDVPRGEVISAAPGAGAEVRKGSDVTLTVSKGPERYEVPAVVGMSRAEAERQIEGVNLKVGKVGSAFSEKVPEGQVVSAKPGPGASLKPGTAVALTVSKGRQPISVPDFTGKPVKDATRALADLGLKVDSKTQENSDTVPKGSVISQDPRGGTLYRSDTVKLVVSKGPVMVEVPNVVGQQTQQARQALEGAGFQVTVRRALGGYFGTVRLQDPAGGSRAPKGSMVTITIV